MSEAVLGNQTPGPILRIAVSYHEIKLSLETSP
jgi:hypothetical protein